MNVDPRINRQEKIAQTNIKVSASPVSPLEILLTLEGDVRAVPTYEALGHFMCNETRKLVAASQIMFFAPAASSNKWRLKTGSSVSSVDRNAPMVRRAEQVIASHDAPQGACDLDRAVLKDADLVFDHGVIMPLVAPNGLALGRLLFLRAHAFQPAEKVMIERVAGAYGHALSFFAKSKRSAKVARNFKLGLTSAVVLSILAMMVPVPMSVLAPVEIVARDPLVVTAPMDGVIRSIDIEPNGPVHAGDAIVHFNDTELAGRLEVTERNLDVAKARNKRVLQGASLSADMRREIAVTKSELAVAAAERDEANAALARSIIYAPRDGLAIFASKDDWVGRPVATGERIMEIGDPKNIEFRIEVGVGDSVVLDNAASVRIFLHNDPLNAIDGAFEKAGYRAEETADGRLAYMVKAQLAEESEKTYALRIGLRGTARISNGTVSLGYYIFRRPISTIRQWVGV